MPSSVIQSFDYDAARRVLTVRFVGGRVYTYADVPADIVAALGHAPSRGHFFATVIRDCYVATRIGRSVD